MKIRADIAKLLHAGHSDHEIARRLHVCERTAGEARRALRLPKHTSGVKPADSPQDLFRQRTRRVKGGHLKWTGYHTNDGVPFFRWRKRGMTAYRVAFQIQHNRPPVGYVRPGCDYPHCVAPEHVEDQQMRDQLKTQMASIFGGAQ
ncbi:helix-turn-helix domain-containing protein [Streptomyces sp. NBC_01102]|uniref:hypothetical protein n=1 Tax=Streptomyces sp. NBC_01102 TaxID=2903749 RepID=UPI00386EF385|nr:helix-turn-helix domain-containing protein [Streptomyces sp. NBC_01102]